MSVYVDQAALERDDCRGRRFCALVIYCLQSRDRDHAVPRRSV